MTLAGRVWNTLNFDDRLRLLRHCGTITHEEIKRYEATLRWSALMPVTQNDLLAINFSGILERDVTP